MYTVFTARTVRAAATELARRQSSRTGQSVTARNSIKDQQPVDIYDSLDEAAISVYDEINDSPTYQNLPTDTDQTPRQPNVYLDLIN